MRSITVYSEPYVLRIPQEAEVREVLLPGCAEADKTLLLQWLHGKPEHTQRAYLSDVHKFYDYAGVSLQEVTLTELQGYANTLTGKRSSRNRHMAALKSVLTFGKQTGFLALNVGSAIKLRQPEDQLAERILSEKEVARMFALERDQRNYAILSLLYHGGLRVAELCALEWRHLIERDEAGQVTVYGKGDTTRTILLDSTTWSTLMALRPVDAPATESVFLSRQADKEGRRQISEAQAWRIVEQAAVRAGIAIYTDTETQEKRSKVSPHWFRHSHATHALDNGASIAVVQKTLGHKSINTTAKYTHVRPGVSSAQYLKV